MARTDRRSPTGFLVRCSAQTSPLFIRRSLELIVVYRNRSNTQRVLYTGRPR